MTTPLRPDRICIAEYVSWPFERVTSLFEAAAQRDAMLFRDPVRVSRSIARVSVTSSGPRATRVAELRVIAVTTGRDPITELFLVVTPTSATPRALQRREARALLDAIVRELDARIAASEPSRLAS
jgi:hypothetical protein